MPHNELRKNTAGQNLFARREGVIWVVMEGGIEERLLSSGEGAHKIVGGKLSL